jgi:hypothetical protein
MSNRPRLGKAAFAAGDPWCHVGYIGLVVFGGGASAAAVFFFPFPPLTAVAAAA